MLMADCNNCGRRTGFKRALGFGTLFMVVLTAGLWLLVIPFYPARCVVCGTGRSEAYAHSFPRWLTSPREKKLLAAAAVVAIVVILGSLIQRSDERSGGPAPIINAYEQQPASQAAALQPRELTVTQVSPQQLKSSQRRYLHRKVGIIGATVTRIDTRETIAERFGVYPPPGCDYTVQLNGFIAACIRLDQVQPPNRLWTGKDVGLECVVEAVNEPIVVVDQCILIPSFRTPLPGELEPAVRSPQEKSWLDEPLTNWNHQGLYIPKPEKPFLDPECRNELRGPATETEKEVVHAGWLLSKGVQQPRAGSVTTVVVAYGATEGMCRPGLGQAFVFLNGRFVGTVSPRPSAARTTGDLEGVRISSPASIEADFSYYNGDEAMCCPSRLRTVRYEIRDVGLDSVLVPIGQREQRNPRALGGDAQAGQD